MLEKIAAESGWMSALGGSIGVWEVSKWELFHVCVTYDDKRAAMDKRSIRGKIPYSIPTRNSHCNEVC